MHHAEGMLFAGTKLYERGKRNEAVWNFIGCNSRAARQLQGDLDASVKSKIIDTPSQSVRSSIQAEPETQPGVRCLAPKHVGRKKIPCKYLQSFKENR
jgi:hypothetical protein